MSTESDLAPLLQASIHQADRPKVCKKLSQKILEITTAVKQVKKGGLNRDANYKYIRIEDAVAAVVPEMTKRGLILTPLKLNRFEMTDQQKGYNVNITITWQLEDVESGEAREYEIPGSGWDFHDKGTYKAITGNRKYALILIFQLPVGDDAEARGGIDFAASRAKQQEVLEKKLAKAGKGPDSQVSQREILINRPKELLGKHIAVFGYTFDEPMQAFFRDTDSKRYQSKSSGETYWRVPVEYEKGLIELCSKCEIEVKG